MSEITAILPYFSLSENDSSRHQIIEELIELSGQISVHIEKGSSIPLKISEFQPARGQQRLKQRLARISDTSSRQFLRLSIPVPKPTTLLIEEYSDLFKEEDPDFVLPEPAIERIITHRYRSALTQRVGDIVLAVNIANPGLLFFDSYSTYINNRSHRQERGFPWIFAEPVSYVKHLGWPPIQTLHVNIVWKWLANLPGFDSGLTKGRVGRAISALTYLIPSDIGQTSPSDLVWALLGLEALYCNGNQGLKSQLMEKSAVVLGPRLANAKKFSAMYDFRSRFLHGDINFPRAHFEIEDDNVANFMGEAYDCWSVAVGMLISTIQYLVANNLVTLEFDYTVRPG